MNLFIYLDGLKVNFDFKVQVFPGRQDRKTNSFVCLFWEKLWLNNFVLRSTDLWASVRGRHIYVFTIYLNFQDE